MLNRFYL